MNSKLDNKKSHKYKMEKEKSKEKEKPKYAKNRKYIVELSDEYFLSKSLEVSS